MELPEMSGALAAALVAAGLGSPAAIVDAGLDRLRAVPEVGERADKIYAAAEEWVAAQAAHPAPPVADAESRDEADGQIGAA
jgi:hypothetical protein